MQQLKCEPITIDPKRILAAAQAIANGHDDAWQYTPQQFLDAVHKFLEKEIGELLYDADWHANRHGFEVEDKFDYSINSEETLVMPLPPEWEAAERPAQRAHAGVPLTTKERVAVGPDGEPYAI